jgi:sugar transferase (PEP-CTERM system associated)
MMLRILKQYYPIRNALFIIGEGIIVYISVLIASWILLGTESFAADKWVWFKTLLITFVCQTCLYYNDLYDLKITDTFTELALRLLQALGFSAIILAFIYIVFPETIIGRGIFIVSIAFVIVFIVSWRFCYSLIIDRGIFNQKIILLGSGKLAQNIMNEINDKKDCGYTVSLVVPDSSDNTDLVSDKNAIKLFENNYQGLCEIAKSFNINKIIVALTEKRGIFPTQELLKCRVDGIDVLEGNSFYESLTGKLIVEHINPGWLIFSDGFQKPPFRRFLKRTVDLILSFTFLVILLPVIIITTILIKIDSRGPVFFSQKRLGKKRKKYMMYKFRSMITGAEKLSGPVWAEDNDDRITRVGKFIRKWRIDEIPQLWNVLKGNMSFVGPRPEREFFVKKLADIIPYYDERFTVKPGITGWAQVSYGYGASVDDAIEKLNYDLFYIKNLSTFMDCVIVFRTIKIVLFGKGAR